MQFGAFLLFQKNALGYMYFPRQPFFSDHPMDMPLVRLALDTSDVGLRLELIVVVLSLCYSVFFIFQKLFPNYLFGEDSEYAGYIYTPWVLCSV